MKQGLYTIKENRRIARGVYRMVLSGDTSAITAPGQFVNVQIEGCFLRRPVSICDWDEETITLLYKVVGKGTDKMAAMKVGETLDLLTGLGNGFNLGSREQGTGSRVLIVGGGIGAAPLYGLLKRVQEVQEFKGSRVQEFKGSRVQVVLGAASKDDLVYVDEFKALGAEVIIATDDGSEGIHGLVTDAMAGCNCDYVYCCGPMPMMKAVHRLCKAGQFSLEERMGCGFGACMGCSVEIQGESKGSPRGVQGEIKGSPRDSKRVCKDGPVFRKEELVW